MAETSGSLSVECPLCNTPVRVPFAVVRSIRQTNEVDVRLKTDGPLREHLNDCAAKAGDKVGQTVNTLLGNITEPAAPGKALEKAKPHVSVPQYELTGRVGQVLAIVEDKGTLTTAGSRACLMCGTNLTDCLVDLDVTERSGKLLSTKRTRSKGTACCPACANGNTHPSPKDGESCAEWGRENGAKS